VIEGRLTAALALGIGLSIVRLGAESFPASVTGPVIVKACAKPYGTHKFWGDEWRLDTEAAQQAANCSAAKAGDPKSDLGMVVDGAFYEFDKKGQTLAREVLGKAPSPTTAVLTVNGRVIKTIGGWIPTTPGSGFRIPPEHKNQSRAD
jgi:hypothetical protein